MLQTIKRMIRKGMGRADASAHAPLQPPHAGMDNADYWTSHNVTNHLTFADTATSFAYLEWRNDQYPGYIDLMPVIGQDGKIVVDYGCGPGNDLVGFGAFSRPARLIGMDISSSSLRESRARLELHGIQADLFHLNEGDARLPLEDRSVDYVHSSGVVQCTKDPAKVLREFRRIVRPTGKCRIMVYHYDSLWLHLYVAYVIRIKGGQYADMDMRSAFSHTTDGPHCPISRVYQIKEFSDLAAECGFKARFLGAAMSLIEMGMLPQRFEAAQRQELEEEHRKFLLELTLDARGFPLYRDHYAGVDGCYELVPV